MIPGNKFSGCKTDLVPEALWEDVKTRIESIEEGSPECTGAKGALLDLWNRGREAGGIRFWEGIDYQYNGDGTPRYLSRGVRAAILGNYDGAAVLYDGIHFWTRRTLPAHEGIHRYFHLTGDPRGERGEPLIHALDDSCPATWSP